MDYEKALQAIQRDLAMYKNLSHRTKDEYNFFNQNAAFGAFTFWKTIAYTDLRFPKDLESLQKRFKELLS